ncbi:MAG: sigma-70 family RNA polymerase sigma factor [Ignavibacteria bacterium]|nr:sigma-70 family RNA polymerase sigma factor [Ignavibacteria bacterium]
MIEPKEFEIIEKAKKGDRSALEELVRKYERTVYSFAFKICRDKDKAENTMQETFLSVVKSLNQFDGNSKFSTWLYRIVVNHCLMMARSSVHVQGIHSLDDEELAFDEPEVKHWTDKPEDVLLNDELKSLMDKAISKLSAEYRIVFLLRDVEGLSTEETAKSLGLSVPAVKSRLHRARLFLRNELKNYFEN